MEARAGRGARAAMTFVLSIPSVTATWSRRTGIAAAVAFVVALRSADNVSVE